MIQQQVLLLHCIISLQIEKPFIYLLFQAGRKKARNISLTSKVIECELNFKCVNDLYKIIFAARPFLKKKRKEKEKGQGMKK